VVPSPRSRKLEAARRVRGKAGELTLRKLAFAFVLVVAGAFVAQAGTSPTTAAPEGSSVATGSTQDGPTYVGARTECRKCHIRIFRSWEMTPHSGTMEVLSEEEKTDADCVRCHVTGFGDPSGFTSMEETAHLGNVGCEACHGAGSEYSNRATMQNRDAAIEAGLVIPDEQTCRGCHNEESPTFKGFDYETMKAEGIHEIG
jgi:hypothetical protein